jgi:hypothetical protein
VADAGGAADWDGALGAWPGPWSPSWPADANGGSRGAGALAGAAERGATRVLPPSVRPGAADDTNAAIAALPAPAATIIQRRAREIRPRAASRSTCALERAP